MIELEGVILRPIEEEDVDSLYAYRNDRAITKALVGFSNGYSRRDIADWIERHRQRADEVLWAIADQASGRCLGHVGIYSIDARVRKGEFGILLGDKDWHGRGVGRAASAAMIDYGFRQLNLNRISLSVLASNVRAQRLYQSLGFVEEGVLREDTFLDGVHLDTIVMSILRKEWA